MMAAAEPRIIHASWVLPLKTILKTSFHRVFQAPECGMADE